MKELDIKTENVHEKHLKEVIRAINENNTNGAMQKLHYMIRDKMLDRKLTFLAVEYLMMERMKNQDKMVEEL